MNNFLNFLKLVILGMLLFFLMSFTLKNDQTKERKFNLIELYDSDERFVTHEDIIKITNNDDHDFNIARIEKTIKQIPQIKNVKVYLNHDGNIDVQLQERQPILRVYDKNLSFYLDSECKVLPISKSYTARRLIITGNLDYYSNSELCNLYSVIESNEFYKSLITQIDVQKNNTILITRIKNLEVNIGNLDRLKIKFENLMTFYNRIVKFKGWDFYDKVNLKYIDQIICSKK